MGRPKPGKHPSFYSFLHPSFVCPSLLPHIPSGAKGGSSQMSHVHKHSSSDLDCEASLNSWSGVCALCFCFNSQFVSRRAAAAAAQRPPTADTGAGGAPETQQQPQGCIGESLPCTHIPTRATCISFMHIHGATWATWAWKLPLCYSYFFAFANTCRTFTNSLTHKCKVW